MVRWKRWYTIPNIADGTPLEQGGLLNVEGEQVFEKISKMPIAKPITPRELDIEFCEFLDSLPDQDRSVAMNLGPIFWAVSMDYQIVYSSDDYEVQYQA